MGFIETLLDTEPFTPRSMCGQWTPGWQALAVATDLVYGVSYFVIPIFLIALWYVKRRVYGRAGYTLWVFAGFILGCGVSHVGQVLVWWWPAYRLFIALSLPGAMLSVACAFLMPPMWWHFRFMRTPSEVLTLNDELHRTIRERDRADEAKDAAYALLADQNRELKAGLAQFEDFRSGWKFNNSQHEILDDLYEKLHALVVNGGSS